MPKFKFRLQTSLDLAVRYEQIAREELLQRIKERDVLAAELERITGQIAGLENEIRYSMTGSESLARIQLLRNFLPVLQEQREETASFLAAAAEKVEQARQVLVERMKETKTLNRLREKEWQAYCQELLKEEQKQIDEVATTRFLRKNGDSDQ